MESLIKPKRGGPRKGAGRKPTGVKPVQYCLSEVAIRRIEEMARHRKTSKSAVLDRMIRKFQFS